MPLTPLPLPPGLRESQITSSASELSYHIIEAGIKGSPLILLLHGFPELAYSWRKVMPSLEKAGYYIVAFDQRGYGRTAGWDTRKFEEVDLHTFAQTNLVRDMMVLVYRLGYHQVECVVGHDFGCVPAALSALIRPDVFRKVILLGHPFQGSPKLPFGISPEEEQPSMKPGVIQQLGQLTPPRKHYRWYYSTPEANEEMAPLGGLHEFLRGYFHLKSGDAESNPHPLQSMTATELAKLPHYYVMPLELGMRETIAQDMTAEEQINARNKFQHWLPESELEVYVTEFGRTGFQGGVNWYRIMTDPKQRKDLDLFAGKKIEVPLLCVSGTKDWLIHQTPGAMDSMKEVCINFRGVAWIEGAGHWPQQERPEGVVEEVLKLLRAE
jgi:pimeloyl-ACP methyl ester carboxylesterase